MAWRIDEAVVRGEIDNTVEGKTTGWLWLLGREQPVELDLTGDCWRDLAGTRLNFRNPEPKPQPNTDLASPQKGVVGDMTASRKNKVPLVSNEEFAAMYAARQQIPFCWKNTLYLEWFSEENGRVVIETCDFALELSEHVWEMDDDAEEAQKLANMQAMRDFMNVLVRRIEPTDRPGDDGDEEDEFQWEERLKESDRLADAYQEVLEKYLDDPDAERKEAFAMGWDGLLEALAEENESPEPVEAPTWKPEDSEREDWDEEADMRQHPLQARAQDLVIRGIDLTRAGGEHPAGPTLNAALMQVAGKLAGALNGDYERETGYVLAMLKRCLGWQNDALAACSELIAAADDNDHSRALEALKDSIFEIREEIVNLRKELKEN
ncbi:hypothetical protein [Luteolibacter luteus]|uniref:Uncharacterized protein n=1 Tax=Luteolibacter luteus TaxID=2728835 RepID=A0A858RJ11_9BACT|nr:hypothetical protein [Luteolibacter luteus]QJE96514.1 hypothetical protein HHL09_12225 [Luteolibacter luteus]